VSTDEALAREAKLDEQERRQMLEDRTAEAMDGLYRAARDCLEVAEDLDANSAAGALVDGLLRAEHDCQKPARPFPFDRAQEINVEFLLVSAERFLADIRTAAMLLRSTGPVPGGRRHGPDPGAEEACICGWRSTAPDRVSLAHHFLAVVELGGGR
jgi:hypothetical protein